MRREVTFRTREGCSSSLRMQIEVSSRREVSCHMRKGCSLSLRVRRDASLIFVYAARGLFPERGLFPHTGRLLLIFAYADRGLFPERRLFPHAKRLLLIFAYAERGLFIFVYAERDFFPHLCVCGERSLSAYKKAVPSRKDTAQPMRACLHAVK